MFLFPLILIPLLALLNHLRGQNDALPDSRLAYTALMGLAYGLAAWAASLPWTTAVFVGATTAIGLIFWDVWTWGNGFLAVSGQDTRDYTRMPWLCALCDALTGVTPLTKLTRDQCLAWGAVYMTARGLFLVPLFIALAFLLHRPEIAVLGPLGASQGIVYRASPSVYVAEFIFGGVIGAPLAATLLAF